MYWCSKYLFCEQKKEKKIKQTANHGGLQGKDVSHAKRHIQMLRDSTSKLIKTLDILNTQKCSMKIHLEIGIHLTRILVQIGKILIFIFHFVSLVPIFFLLCIISD